MPRLVLLVVVVALLVPGPAFAQPRDPKATWTKKDNVDGRWNETEVGPFLASVLPTPSGTVAKGLSIRVGEKEQAAVCYDTASMSLRAAWTGGFLKFDPYKFGIVRAPKPDGEIVFHDGEADWGDAEVEYVGTYQHGRRVALSCKVDGTPVLETPGFLQDGETVAFARTLAVEPHAQSLTLQVFSPKSAGGRPLRVRGPRQAVQTVVADGHTAVVFPPSKERVVVTVCIGRGDGDRLDALLATAKFGDPATLARPGPRVWKESLTTQGVRAEDDAPYVVDTIGVPFDNPWKALMFLSGHDFLSNGDLAVCTLYGDVWLVQGIDETLQEVTWRRFATGLHQPLGLKVVDDVIHVLGRDQITRLHDRDGNGEADFYECFNNDGRTSTSGHDYAACLQTDPEGDFYYIRAHEGVCRVSADGERHESIAKGFRNPVGLGVGPGGTITAAPQEGNWTPKSAIFEVRPGGYYGFGGPRESAERPLGYDPPICWLPRLQDNSSGGQVWVTSDRWGPLKGSMLHLSYGQCALLLVPFERVDGVPQGGSWRFPLVFESGVMRGRFSPHDGQLYVSGLRGWQTLAAKDGCLQRVRYTGKPVHAPAGIEVTPDGVALTFTRPLDPETAADPDSYAVEVWNYRYRKEYGSEDFRVSNPRRKGRDEVFVDAARLSNGNRTVELVLEEHRPVMQMGITWSVNAADGTRLRDTVFSTVNVVPSGERAAGGE